MPSPERPSRLISGTLQSSKKSDETGLARMPQRSSISPTVKPGVPFSTMNTLAPRPGLSGSVMAKMRGVVQTPPLVTKILVPLMT